MTTFSSHLPLDLLKQIQAFLPEDTPLYVVGGAIRDAMLDRPIHDLDLILPGNVIETGRKLAHHLKAAFYPLDVERDTVRLFLSEPLGELKCLDIAAMRGPDLESDLRDRDFTINAMALALHNDCSLVDPLNGAADLRHRQLRACSETSIRNDPVRAVRAVRQAIALGLKIDPQTQQLIREAAPLLVDVSRERLRDEIFRILDGPRPAAAIRTLDLLGALPYTLPELSALKGITQPLPHTHDAWTHTLAAAQKLHTLLNVLAQEPDPEISANWTYGLVSLRLGRYRSQLDEHLKSPLNPERSIKALLIMAALYHDIGKPATRKMDENRRIRFIDHERIGSQLAGKRGHQLRLSNNEVERLKIIVGNHMRPILLAKLPEMPTKRAIYRYFRDCGPAGVDIGLLALADTLATYESSLPQEIWARQLEVVRTLLETWWENPRTVSPPALLNGYELIQTFNLTPGKLIGQLLDELRESQAAGEIHTREEALDFARLWISKNQG
ncbi:MAG: HD domain-containing protein [Anaerolineales bacterium]|nr:HD domain-containing protein [Anaerolineales bacterium]